MTSIAEIPDDIICHIICLVGLTSKEAIQLSLLSKELFRALRKRPALRFAGGNKKELDFVHETLVRYHADGVRLDTFTFKMGDEYNNFERRCITLAAKKSLRHLDLHGTGELPKSVCKTQSLVKLGLRGFTFAPKTSIVWPNLRQLSLHSVEIGTEDFENILLASPLIQTLDIIYCSPWKVNYFKVYNLRNLKQLNVGLTGIQTFEVKDAPELESITCSHRSHGCYQEIPNIGRYKDVNAGVYQNLKTLSLDHVHSNGNIFRNLDHQFPHLENLSISNNAVLLVLVLSSSSLKNLRLEKNPNLDTARFDLPSVVLFEYITDAESRHTAPIPEISFSDDPPRICHIKLNYTCQCIDTRWFLKLNEFLTTLNMSEISITVKFNGPISEHKLYKNSQRCILGLKPKVHEFHIDINWEFSLSFAKAVVDTIFWICEPETVTYPPDYRGKFERLVDEKRISEDQRIRSSSTWFGFKFLTRLLPVS